MIRAFAEYRPGVIAALVVVAMALVALFADVLPLKDPAAFSPDVLRSPSAAHLMGTDNLGRDILIRVIAGARSALLVALVSAGISIVIGVVLGSVAGYFGGWVDDVLSRLFDVFLLVPAFFLLVLVVALFGSSLFLVMVVIGLTTWPGTARIMRSQVLTYKSRVFVEAARASGAGPIYLLTQHVVPNGIGPVITHGTVLMGQAILTEAGLSYLGLSDPTAVSWGRMVFEGQTYLGLAPWMAGLPGLVMLIAVLALNIAGDGITYALQPGSRRRRRAAVTA